MASRLAEFAAIGLLAGLAMGCGGLLARVTPAPTPSDAIETSRAAFRSACVAGCSNTSACLGDAEPVQSACVQQCDLQAAALVSSACASARALEAECFAQLDCSVVTDYFGDAPSVDVCAIEAAAIEADCGPRTP